MVFFLPVEVLFEAVQIAVLHMFIEFSTTEVENFVF
jgi:hypothetical protein